MANPEQLDTLKQGVEAWNQWKQKHPYIHADLSGADLRGVNLNRANFRGVNLNRANFRGADLTETNLTFANLYGTNFRGADLRLANIINAAGLGRTDLTSAIMGGTALGGDIDLSM